jgi:hypothetical protein
MLTKHNSCYKHFFRNKNIYKKLRLKNTIIDKTLICASETWTLTKKGREEINIFERTVYRRILDPVYNIKTENVNYLIKNFMQWLKTHRNTDTKAK